MLLAAAIFAVAAAAGAGERRSGGDPRAQPCMSEPAPGSGLVTSVRSSISTGPNEFVYTWTIRSLAASTRSALTISLSDVRIPLSASRSWECYQSLPDTDFKNAGCVDTDPAGRFDLRPKSSLTISGKSTLLPSVTVLRIWPTRPEPCLPDSDEGERALARNGFTLENFEDLTKDDLNTNRELVAAPVLVKGDRNAPELFAVAMNRLEELEEYVAYIPAGNLRPRLEPHPTDSAGQFYGKSIEANLRLVMTSSWLPARDLALVKLLAQFYRKSNAPPP